jgi:streptogramin lyase
LKAAVNGIAPPEVTGILYKILCNDGTTVEQYVALEEEGLPRHVDEDRAGLSFADFFTTLPVGDCTVTATAMQSVTDPYPDCPSATKDVTIVADETTEAILIIECKAPARGALDVVTVVTTDPWIIEVNFDDSKFIIQCEGVTITVSASGGDGELTYTYEVIDTPTSAVYTSSSDGAEFTFAAETPGEYTIQVTVTDGDDTATMTFPIHVGDNPSIEHCEEVCCQLEDGHTFAGYMTPCEEAGGVVVNDELCAEEVCCETPTGYNVIASEDCPQGGIVSMDLCTQKELCCQTEGGVSIVGSPAECEKLGGAIVVVKVCQPEVCCELENGGFQTVPQSTCEKLNGVEVAKEECFEVCCQLEGFQPVTTTLGDCALQGGTIVTPKLCLNQVHVWVADYTLDLDTNCDPSPYLVVPSSGANKLAVYDLATLNPLPTTPFATCSNPSRIMMDANTDVFATCRGDGKVYKHTRDGALLWGIQLPACGASRGIVMSGNGRLFAGCSDSTGVVSELDPVTGAVLNSVTTDYPIYGLATDPDGIYVSHYFASKVSKIFLGGANDMTVAWTVSMSAPYGITVDQLNQVWVSGSSLRALSTADGSLINTVVTTGATYGVQVGLDGNVYSSRAGTNTVFKWDPIAGASSVLNLDAAAVWNHGLTLDTQNNVYAINLNSSTLTRVTPAGVATGFSPAGVLLSPYGYSGDMTGLTTTCIAGTTDTWFSTPIDSGAATTTWLTISWNSTMPPGSGVAVYYRLDGAATWTQATNGQTLNVVGQVMEVKAILSSTIAGNEPTLTDVTVVYQ